MIRSCFSLHRPQRIWSINIADSLRGGVSNVRRNVYTRQLSIAPVQELSPNFGSPLAIKSNRRCIHQLRSLSISNQSIDENLLDKRRGRKVWKARDGTTFHSNVKDSAADEMMVQPTPWDKAVDDDHRSTVHESLARICEQVRFPFKSVSLEDAALKKTIIL
jgi:hypothetical protein